MNGTKRLFQKRMFPAWIFFPTYEKVSWLNQELKRIWPYVDQAASSLLKTLIEPMLEVYKPSTVSSLRFQKFTLGTVAPQITGVRVVESAMGEIVFELALQWDGNPSIILNVATMMGISLPVQVKDSAFSGKFRVMLKPLIDEAPCIGAVVYSLEEIEKFDLNLKVVGGEVTSLPGIEGIIEGTIRTAVEDSLLWPARKIIPITPGDYRDLELQVLGILEVNVVQARDLKNKDIIGKSDPFAKLFVRKISSRVKKTKTINNDTDPIWNEHFMLEVEDLNSQKLTIEVLDDEGLQPAQLIGTAQIELKNLKPEEYEDIWVPLYKKAKKGQLAPITRGEVHVELTYRTKGGDVSLVNPTTIPTLASIPTTAIPLTAVEKIITSNMNGPKTTPYKSLMKEGAVIRGILQVTVIRGENLLPSDFNQHCDPYVVLTMKKSDARKTTKVIPKNLNPEWNQHFDFMVEDALHDMLLVDVFDHDTFMEKRLGKCAITLTRVLREGEHDSAVQLLGSQDSRIFMKLRWVPPVPPDLQYI